LTELENFQSRKRAYGRFGGFHRAGLREGADGSSPGDSVFSKPRSARRTILPICDTGALRGCAPYWGLPNNVIPAKAGIHFATVKTQWIPAFAGMTNRNRS
jgi:hypothetical protein